jgi:hypothetical protein
MGFRDAVTSTPGLEHAYRPGLQALRTADHDHVSCRNTRTLTGSVDLDNTLASLLPDDARWDYGVGLKPASKEEKVIWIEVHPASSSHVDGVLRKLEWLKTWLRTQAPQLKAFPPQFFWIASGSVALPATSQQRRKVASTGLRFVTHLALD